MAGNQGLGAGLMGSRCWRCYAPSEEGVVLFGEISAYLRDWACKINMEKIKKAPPRKPTKEKTKPIKDKSPHLSTARLLDQAKKKRQGKPKSPIQR